MDSFFNIYDGKNHIQIIDKTGLDIFSTEDEKQILAKLSEMFLREINSLNPLPFEYQIEKQIVCISNARMFYVISQPIIKLPGIEMLENQRIVARTEFAMHQDCNFAIRDSLQLDLIMLNIINENIDSMIDVIQNRHPFDQLNEDGSSNHSTANLPQFNIDDLIKEIKEDKNGRNN